MTQVETKNINSSFFNLTATTLQGEELSMNNFRGKTILIVNTASKCGFTQQYKGLEEMYLKYKDRGLVVLGFPCNQFGNQEPGDNHSIEQGCLLNYGVSFPMFSKIHVFGPQMHPIYAYLKKELPGLFGGRILWNFTKFLINEKGRPIRRFAPISTPEKIDRYLAEKVFC